MNQIDEWNSVYAKQVSGAGASNRRAPDLVRAIREQLVLLDPAPATVHFYRGEGLRWVRVGFGDRLLEPSDVEAVGRAIQGGIDDRKDPLYFHSLRAYDLLFFLEDFDPESTGLPPKFFGAPLDDVLAAWWPAPASRKRKQA